MRLSNATLPDLPETVLRPTYDRSKLTPGIVHIGLGNFHRGHQAWYLHRLMQQGLAHDWAIIGAGVRPYDAAMREKLIAQDCLTTLIELDPAGRSAEVVGSMIDYLPIDAGNGALIAQMADPATRIAALTVTEGGYYIDPVTKGFDENHADIQHDAAHPDTPRTAFGAMVAALKLRRDTGTGPFTGQSCDNLQGNGAILRQTVVSLARLSDPELADWIDANCSFPNSMVDCIVPATGPKELELVKSFGVDDAAPVTHENFRQWVIEDDFCAGRPDWDKAGATFTDDVHSFEAMKIRILNGGHQLISDPGEILSVEFISGCMAHPLIGPFFRKVAEQEIAPHVDPVPGMTPAAYVDLIERRFSNPEIVDTVRRVAFDGSSRHTGFILPVLREALAAGGQIDGLVLSQALWARMCEGTREDGSVIEPNDPYWDKLTTAAKAAKQDPQAWLNQRDIYGDLADNARFAESFARWLGLIWSDGTEAALQTYSAGGPRTCSEGIEMQAITYPARGEVNFETLPDPVAGPGEAVVQVRASGICHTDFEVLAANYGTGAFPVVPGHEYAGEVTDVGADVTNVAIGDRVVVDPNIECGTCRSCRRGWAHLCEKLGAYGVTTNGGFAEHSVVKATALHPMGALEFGTAALAEPMGCVLNGLDAVHEPWMDSALIFGAGPMGLLMGIALKTRGIAEVSFSDIDDSRLDLAASFGFSGVAAGSADLERLRHGADLAVDATGVPRVAGGLVDYIANGGKGLFFGVCPSDARIEISPFEVFRRQLTLAGSHSLNHNIPEALETIAAYGPDIQRVVSHQMSLEEVAGVLSSRPPAHSLKIQALMR